LFYVVDVGSGIVDNEGMSMDKIVKDKQGREIKIPRTFMSRAYVQEHDGIFEMYRDILEETNEPDGAGGFLREKKGRIGPMMVFHEARDGEPVDFQTSRPDGTVLMLHRIDKEKAK
jgi:hypothetical protein